jgi:hypothetical protein
MTRIHTLRARRAFAASFVVLALTACGKTTDHPTPTAARPASVVSEVAKLDCGTQEKPCSVEGITVVAARD